MSLVGKILDVANVICCQFFFQILMECLIGCFHVISKEVAVLLTTLVSAKVFIAGSQVVLEMSL